MKLTLLASCLGLSLAFSSAYAQTINIDPFTGDAWIDTRVDDYNDYWRTDRERYLDIMNQRFGYDRQWFEDTLRRGDVSAGELYYACTLARQTGRDCDDVLSDRQEFSGRGQGWGAMAKRYGIKPGSAEFHRMKSSMQRDGELLDRDDRTENRAFRREVDRDRNQNTIKGPRAEKRYDHPGKGGQPKKQKPPKKSQGKGPGGR